uniref:Uncharacterized protein n=1 Tax=Electrophorus electricus TaxID=8005 RepID=A0A4W4HU42_ELEEL
MAAEKQEEVGVALKELQGQRGSRIAAHRVVSAANAQHGDGHLVHVPQRVVALPVGLPGALCWRALWTGLTKQHLLHGSERGAGEQAVCVDQLRQHGLVPAGISALILSRRDAAYAQSFRHKLHEPSQPVTKIDSP